MSGLRLLGLSAQLFSLSVGGTHPIFLLGKNAEKVEIGQQSFTTPKKHVRKNISPKCLFGK